MKPGKDNQFIKSAESVFDIGKTTFALIQEAGTRKWLVKVIPHEFEVMPYWLETPFGHKFDNLADASVQILQRYERSK